MLVSVRLSVTRVLCDKTKQTHCGYFDTTTRKVNHSSFLTSTAVVGGRRVYFSLKFALKVTHPLEKRRLR